MSKPRFFDLLKELKEKVDEYIFKELPLDHEIPEVDLLYKMMRDYPSRFGKGLRPGLLLAFNRAFGGSDEKALTTAAALELFQNWIVIHDDIEDGSDLRRGQPALHIKHGMPLALNAGDALAGKMWELLLKNRIILGHEKTLAIFDEFLMMYAKTTEGQHIELGWENNHRWNISEEDYFAMCRRKTAWYTCISPAWIGSMIAGAHDSLKASIIDFGFELGVAFQIQDDVLNLTGDREKYGKEIGGDILEGKRTLILINLINKCSFDEKNFIAGSLDRVRESKDQNVIDDVMKLMNNYGSIEYAAKVSHDLAKKARQIYLDSIDSRIDKEYRQVFLDLIDFMVTREL